LISLIGRKNFWSEKNGTESLEWEWRRFAVSRTTEEKPHTIMNRRLEDLSRPVSFPILSMRQTPNFRSLMASKSWMPPPTRFVV
jgi:hypothetical protein